MVLFLVSVADLMRPLLFFVLLLYFPLKTGFLFDILVKPTSSTEMQSIQQLLANRLTINTVSDLALLPFRLALLCYLSLWLFIDKHPALWVLSFLITLIPVLTS